MFHKIIVICYANICRSPIGEAILKVIYPEKIISSAGTKALEGQSANPLSVQVIQEQMGFDLSHHRARQLTNDMVCENDLILVMEQSMISKITEKYPIAEGRTFLINHFRDGGDVCDPYKQPLDKFKHTFFEIKEAINSWAPYL